MATRLSKHELDVEFVTGIKDALRERQTRGEATPLVRRKLTTIVSECGYDNVMAAFLVRLRTLLEENGVYTEPPLDQEDLEHDDFVYFSTGPFPADSLLFPKERQLQEFVRSCLGSGRFRGLRLYKDGDRDGWEFPVPGRRVDLLCEEQRRDGKGGLVAMELKRGESAREAVDQLVGYIDKLRTMFPDRRVKGIVISGREGAVGQAILSDYATYDIEWYCYMVEFTPVGRA